MLDPQDNEQKGEIWIKEEEKNEEEKERQKLKQGFYGQKVCLFIQRGF